MSAYSTEPARTTWTGAAAIAVIVAGAVAFLTAATSARAEDPPSASVSPAPTPEADAEPKLDPALRLRIKAWVRRLNHEDFTTREEAAARLVEIGKDALWYLRDAAKASDATLAAAAKKAIADIEAKIKKSSPAPDGEKPDPNRPSQPKQLMPGATDEEIDAFIRKMIEQMERDLGRIRDESNGATNSMTIVFTEDGNTFRFQRNADGSFDVTITPRGDRVNADTRRFSSESDMQANAPDLHGRWLRHKPRDLRIRIVPPAASDPSERARELEEEVERLLDEMLGKEGAKPKVPAPSKPPGAAPAKPGPGGWDNTLAGGARFLEVEAPLRSQLGIAQSEGCVQVGGFVNRGQLLEAAGVKQFDIVFSITAGGQAFAVSSPAAVRDALAKIAEGAAFEVAIMRAGKRQVLTGTR